MRKPSTLGSLVVLAAIVSASLLSGCATKQLTATEARHKYAGNPYGFKTQRKPGNKLPPVPIDPSLMTTEEPTEFVNSADSDDDIQRATYLER